MKKQFITFFKNEKIESNKTKNYINEIIEKNQMLSPEEERKLFIRAKKSSKAGNNELKNKFLLSNTLFFFKVARHYNYKFPNLKSEDLFGEIYLGASKAFDTYKAEYNSRFINWAVGYLKNSVFDYARRNNMIIKIPTRIFKNGKVPEDLEIVDKHEAEKYNIYSNTEIDECANIGTESIEDTFMRRELSKIVIEEVGKLSDVEKEVVSSCFGINQPKMSKVSIGNKLNISQKEVNNTLNRALKKLKKTKIKDYKI